MHIGKNLTAWITQLHIKDLQSECKTKAHGKGVDIKET
jgi:hypothetical protein